MVIFILTFVVLDWVGDLDEALADDTISRIRHWLFLFLDIESQSYRLRTLFLLFAYSPSDHSMKEPQNVIRD